MHTVYSNIKITMPRYRLSEVEKNTVLYEMQVQTREAKWFLTKKFSQFEQLHESLTKYYYEVPDFPQRAMIDLSFFMFNDKDEKERLAKLQTFAQALTIRHDIVNSDFFIEFFQLQKNSPSLVSQKPSFLGQFSVDPMNIDFAKGVRDFYYDEQLRTFFIVTGDMNALSRLNSYLTNTKMPWQGDDIPETLIPVGSVECWVCLTQGYEYEKIWSKIYNSQATCMYYCKSRERLLIGLDDGTIDQLKVSPRNKYVKYEQSATFKIHEERVNGIYYEPINKLMYSISEDTFLTTCDMANYFKMHNISHTQELATMLTDTANKRLFIGANEGHIFVYAFTNKTPVPLFTVITSEDGPIKCLALDLVKNYLFTAGFQAGMISVFDIDKPGREKFAKQIAALMGKEKPRSLVWVPKRMEILVGHGNGTVTFWDSLKGCPMYVLRVDDDEITRMTYDENTRILVVSAKGQMVKFWKIPQFWRDSRMVSRQEEQMAIQRRVDNALKIKELAKRMAQDSDEDDLARWQRPSSPSNDESDSDG